MTTATGGATVQINALAHACRSGADILAGIDLSVAAGGWTALCVTHSAAEAVFLADRVVVLGGRPGQIVGEVAAGLGSPREGSLRTDPAFVAATGEVTRLLDRAGGDLPR